jgi:putative transposase
VEEENRKLKQLVAQQALAERRRWGYRRLHIPLKREGWKVNSKWAYRIYVEEKLVVRRRRRGLRVCAQARVLLSPPSRPKETWTMDFLHDALAGGRTEFTLKALGQWACENKVTLHFITPGRLMENGYIESFHGRFREECLNEHWVLTLDDARETIENWRLDYNRVRPHCSLGYLTLEEFRNATASTDPYPNPPPTGPCAPDARDRLAYWQCVGLSGHDLRHTKHP